MATGSRRSLCRLWGLPAHNDRPPFWTGVPVTWSGWSMNWSTAIYRLPLHELACTQCRGSGNMGFNWGPATIQMATNGGPLPPCGAKPAARHRHLPPHQNNMGPR